MLQYAEGSRGRLYWEMVRESVTVATPHLHKPLSCFLIAAHCHKTQNICQQFDSTWIKSNDAYSVAKMYTLKIVSWCLIFTLKGSLSIDSQRFDYFNIFFANFPFCNIYELGSFQERLDLLHSAKLQQPCPVPNWKTCISSGSEHIVYPCQEKANSGVVCVKLLQRIQR